MASAFAKASAVAPKVAMAGQAGGTGAPTQAPTANKRPIRSDTEETEYYGVALLEVRAPMWGGRVCKRLKIETSGKTLNSYAITKIA